MALKKFIGARYAPEFAGAWSDTKQYAALSVVYADNRSYVSRKTVPAGTPITNTDFWIQSSDWNAQVAEYNLKVEGYNANVEQYNKNVQDYSAAVSGFYADTLHSFDTKADMQANRTLALGETLLTCGNKKIGDGGGSFYQVVSETSITAVALDNGLFAEPFEFQPYDYGQFQQEVEGYKNSTTRVYNTQQDMVADVGINTGNILMTTGALEQGDGQGSFWNVTDNQEEGSMLLQNGKYAKKFNVSSVDASGTLLFNNKGNQVAIWGVKAGGETINVPVSFALGETRNVFVAVEYDSDNTNATVNLVVSGPVSFTKAFAWSDASVTSDQVKTVIYAITLHSKGNSVYTGAQVAASYLTTLEKFVKIFTIAVPELDQSLNAWSGSAVTQSTANLSVNTGVIIKKIYTTPATPSPAGFSGTTVNVEIVGNEGAMTGTVVIKRYNTYANAAFTYNKYIPANTDTTIRISTDLLPLSRFRNPATSFGNYGALNFKNGNFQGKIEYTQVTPTGKITHNVGNADAPWSGAKATYFSVTFTVDLECILHSITVNSEALLNVRISYDGGVGYSSYVPAEAGSRTLDIDMYLEPGTIYTIYGESFSDGQEFATPSAAAGTYGPLTFTEGNYQGTIEIISI